MPAARMASGLISTVSSRFTPPTTFASATPGMERNSFVMPGSASRVRLGASSELELREICTIGWSCGSKRERIGSLISAGS